MKNYFKILALLLLTVMLATSLSGCNKATAAASPEEDLFSTYNAVCDNLICAKKDGLWGYINDNGKVKIDFTYSYATAFQNGLAIVANAESKFGVINKRGKAEIDLLYDSITLSDGVFIGKLDNKYFVLNKNGKQLGGEFSKINYFEEGYGIAYDLSDTQVYTYYLINDKGKIEFTLPSNTRGFLTNGYLGVVDANSNYALYNLNGKKLIDFNYAYLFVVGKYIIAGKIINDEIQYGLIKFNEKTIVDYIYDDIDYDDYYQIIYVEKDNKYGVITTQGKTVVNCNYNGVIRLSEKIYAVLVQNTDNTLTISMLNEKGKDAGQLENNFGSVSFCNGYIAVVNDDGKFGLMNENGKIKISYGYDYLGVYSDKLVSYKSNGKYGCLNIRGKVKIPAEYDNSLVFIDGLAVAEKDGKVGIINKRNKAVVNFEYDNIRTIDTTF